jgi:hypothetical protein
MEMRGQQNIKLWADYSLGMTYSKVGGLCPTQNCFRCILYVVQSAVKAYSATSNLFWFGGWTTGLLPTYGPKLHEIRWIPDCYSIKTLSLGRLTFVLCIIHFSVILKCFTNQVMHTQNYSSLLLFSVSRKSWHNKSGEELTRIMAFFFLYVEAARTTCLSLYNSYTHPINLQFLKRCFFIKNVKMAQEKPHSFCCRVSLADRTNENLALKFSMEIIRH